MLATTVLLAGCVHDTDDFTLIPAESGASLTYYIGVEKSGEEDPWDRIDQSFPVGTQHTGKVTKSNGHDDPWDTINQKYGEGTRRKGTLNKSNGHDDPWDTINEKFGLESVHTGRVKSGDSPEDPWDSIQDIYSVGTKHTGKETKANGDDDPWDTINEQFAPETRHSGRKVKDGEHDDPWDRIGRLFPLEARHTDKTNDRFFMGFEKSTAVFVSFDHKEPIGDRARIVEVRGRVHKLEFADGTEQYVIDAPATWSEGMELVTGFLGATSEKDHPFLGVRFWRTVRGGVWGEARATTGAVAPVDWPQDYFASGASLLVSLPVSNAIHKSDDPWDTIRESFPVVSSFKDGGNGGGDPWDTIGESYPIESIYAAAGKSHDDPWDVIRENVTLEPVHVGTRKTHDDPWDTINDRFSVETVHTGKAKVVSFDGKPVVKMMFVSAGGEKGEADPLSWITELFPTDKAGEVLLTLVDVRGQIGRFTVASGRSLFAVGIPGGWEPGLVIRGQSHLLDTKKMLPLMGAVVWEVDRNLSVVPKTR